MDELNHKTTGPANGIEIDSCLGPNELNNPCFGAASELTRQGFLLP